MTSLEFHYNCISLRELREQHFSVKAANYYINSYIKLTSRIHITTFINLYTSARGFTIYVEYN